MDEKRKLIEDIEKLLNRFDTTTTRIEPRILEFMDEQTLRDIIADILTQQEHISEEDIKWLEKFKKYN